MPKPRLSFVLPVFNPDLILFENVALALRDQSLKDFEAIFVLDGETPGAAEIVKRVFKGDPRGWVTTQEHGGAQRARNYGTSLTSGEFVVCFDSDCIIEPDTAKAWVEMFDKYPDIGIVYGGYKFLDEQGAINSESFDPYTLRVRNYISGCFPVRRQFLSTWNESLKSLQDWDFMLSCVEKGAVGKFLEGYAFSTAYPTPKSISGEGCTDAVWLDRVDAVKRLHDLPEREVCVSSLGYKHEGIALAKLLNADYQDVPNFKPHKYKTIVQLGFSFLPGRVETHASIFNQKEIKKALFWTCDDITDIYNRVNYNAIIKYSTLLNGVCKQYVEDKAGYDLMRKAGFEVEVMPVPMVGELKPLPVKKVFAVDCHPNYGFAFNALSKSLPDVELVNFTGMAKIGDFAGLCHFHPDRTISATMKKAVLHGRPVVSNVKSPHMGYVNDDQPADKFIPEMVEKIREMAYGKQPVKAYDYYSALLGPASVLEAIA